MLGMTTLAGRRALYWLGTALVVLTSSGCGNWWWTSFLDPTQVSGDFRRPVVSEIQRSLTFEDTPPGLAGAEDPTPEDLVAVVEDHRLEKDDAIGIRIPRFVEFEPVTDLNLVVNAVGDVQIPQIGWLHVAGMTARELEAEIVDQCVQKGIFREDAAPPIQIFFPRQRQQYFNIFGAVQAADTYRIIESDFRLLDALSLAGGLPEQVEWVYVQRSQPRPSRTARAPSPPGSRALPPARGPEVPPVVPALLSDLGTGAASGALAQASPVAANPATAPGSEAELIEVIAPPGTTTRSETPPAPAATTPAEPASTGPKWILLNGEWVESTKQPAGTRPAKADEQTGKAAGPAVATATQPSTTEPVTWETAGGDERQRVIRIPADALRRGDGRYNIVIHHRDVIRVDPGPLGEFFMLGQIARPGVYSFTGREITLKQGIAAAGGLGLLAWPSRCEITRRLDQDREQTIPVNLEQIFAGNQPDVYLRPNDIVNVGTNVVAPFLATIRTSFRMSYGFGFVYDRNFGDIDSYQPKENPDTIARIRRANRRANLFQ